MADFGSTVSVMVGKCKRKLIQRHCINGTGKGFPENCITVSHACSYLCNAIYRGGRTRLRNQPTISFNKSTKVLMPRWCWLKLHDLSIDHTAYMTAATHTNSCKNTLAAAFVYSNRAVGIGCVHRRLGE